MADGGLIAVCIILGILCFLLLLFAAACGIACFFAMKTNLTFQSQLTEYSRFFEIVIDTLREDTSFLRSELARTIGAEQIPEYRHLTQGLHTFESHLEAIRNAMKEMNLISD